MNQEQTELPKVLIVEDESVLHRLYSSLLKDHPIRLLQATTHREAKEVFLANPDVKIMVMDGRLAPTIPGEPPAPDTLELVKFIREQGFQGIIIAVSSNPEFVDALVRTGCDFSLEQKSDVPKAIIGFLF